jgi:alpha-mannosidase
VVGTAHLDTQWLWTIQNTIREHLPKTLRSNFELFEQYPDYVFSFEGAFRYALMKEYYPQEYAKLKQYIASGRWRIAGSSWDAGDVNIASPESLIRQVLYGNGFFRREFGQVSRDIFLPDCFGFGFALPSVAAHCGLKGFCTGKLGWGSAVDVPYRVGRWEGVDGAQIVAALDPGGYTQDVQEHLSSDGFG